MADQGLEGVAVSFVSFNDFCEIFFVRTKVLVYFSFLNGIMSSSGEFGNPLRKFKLVFLGEQSGKFQDKWTLEILCLNSYLEQNFVCSVVCIILSYTHMLYVWSCVHLLPLVSVSYKCWRLSRILQE